MSNASTNNFGLTGVSRLLQFGKNGLRILNELTHFKFTNPEGSLVPISGGNPRTGIDGVNDFVTRSYFETNSSNNTVVANISERDALTNVPTGNTVYVKDATSDPNVTNGEYAIYVWTGSEWSRIATEASSTADIGSQSITIDTSVNSSGTIYQVRPGVMVEYMNVIVPSGLVGTPTLKLGDGTVTDVFSGIDDTDLLLSGNQVVYIHTKVDVATNIVYTYNAGGNSESKNLIITIFFGS